MTFSALKRIALLGVANGVRVPENQVNRYQELLQLKQLLTLLDINCVIDVGANEGQFASELRGTGYRGFICCFEPVEAAFRALESRFRDDARWRGYRLALGAEDSRVTMNVNASLSVMSSVLEPRWDWPGLVHEEVELRRLDGLFEEIVSPVRQPRVFLKIDTQGFDLEVLQGATGCVDRIDGLQSELSVVPVYEQMPSYLDALGAYERAGFELFNLSVVSRGDEEQLLELNCFMRRPATRARE